jgi:pimeloyl-ACP methyl ester carboxylesterase
MTWRAYSRVTHKPEVNLAWQFQGKALIGEPERYRADVPNAKVVVLDAGHFALDTKADEIAELVREFMRIWG